MDIYGYYTDFNPINLVDNLENIQKPCMVMTSGIAFVFHVIFTATLLMLQVQKNMLVRQQHNDVRFYKFTCSLKTSSTRSYV